MIEFDPRVYVCERAPASVVIDGKLDEWDGAAWTEYFVDIMGPSKPKPRFKTRAKMMWDDTYFYFAAWMDEPHLWATYTKRDSIIFHENDFEVFLDPDGDTHHYYELEINVLGTEWDLLLLKPYRDGGPAIHEWNMAGLKTAIHAVGTINDPSDRDRGWSVEIAMPWTAVREGRPEPGDQWRVNFSRVQWRRDVVDGKYVKKKLPEDNWVWSPQGLINMHYPEMWGFVQFGGPYVPLADEQTKWELRKLYYKGEVPAKRKGWKIRRNGRVDRD